jgi:hypothetical protein
MIEYIERRRVASVHELQRGGIFSKTWGLEGLKTMVNEGETAAFCLLM